VTALAELLSRPSAINGRRGARVGILDIERGPTGEHHENVWPPSASCATDLSIRRGYEGVARIRKSSWLQAAASQRALPKDSPHKQNQGYPPVRVFTATNAHPAGTSKTRRVFTGKPRRPAVRVPDVTFSRCTRRRNSKRRRAGRGRLTRARRGRRYVLLEKITRSRKPPPSPPCKLKVKASTSKEVFILSARIHNTFDDAPGASRQLTYDLASTHAVAYSWPSQGQAPKAYCGDEAAVGISAPENGRNSSNGGESIRRSTRPHAATEWAIARCSRLCRILANGSTRIAQHISEVGSGPDVDRGY